MLTTTIPQNTPTPLSTGDAYVEEEEDAQAMLTRRVAEAAEGGEAMDADEEVGGWVYLWEEEGMRVLLWCGVDMQALCVHAYLHICEHTEPVLPSSTQLIQSHHKNNRCG